MNTVRAVTIGHTESEEGSRLGSAGSDAYIQLLCDERVIFDSRKDNLVDFLAREYHARIVDVKKSVNSIISNKYVSKGLR